MSESLVEKIDIAWILFSRKNVNKRAFIRLEKEFKIKFPELNAALYSSRGKMNIDMGLEKTIFSYSNFNQIVEQINNCFDEHLAGKFQANYPTLIHSAKWKFDYIITSKIKNE